MVVFSTLDLSEINQLLSGVRQNNNADLIAVTETWLRPEDTESFISSILVISSLMYLEMSRKGAELAFHQGGPEF